MKSICGKLSASLAVVAALCVVTSASASAAQWWVAGSTLTGSTALATTTKVEESISLTMNSGEAKITCSSATLYESGKESLAIIAPGTLKMGLALGGCAESLPAHCSVPKTIVTEPLTATATSGTFPADKILLKPTTGSVFGDLEFKGGTCALAGEKPFAGSFTLLVPTGQEELTEQALVGQGSKESPAGVTFYGQPMYLSGDFKLKLASGKKWSFH